jgi:hypothetical protein
MLASAAGFLLSAGAAHAQTEVIQQEVEAKLWIQRVLTRIQTSTGVSPLVSTLILIALGVVLLGACIWLWGARRKRATK